MRLFELFDENASLSKGGSMIDHMRDLILDYLTPFASNEVEFVDMADIKEILEIEHTGIMIDRSLIMQVIDPDVCSMVKKIDGNKVYISFPVSDIAAKNETDEEKDREKVSNMASDTASDELTK